MFYITEKFGRTKVVVEAFSLEFFLSERTSVVLMYTHECVSIKQMPHRVNIIKKIPTIMHRFHLFSRMQSTDALIISRDD
jgi:hypothetical protein